MKPTGAKHLSVLLAGALLLCHGVFGVVHLICARRNASLLPSTRRSTGWRTPGLRPARTSTPRGTGPAPSTSPCSPVFSASW